ncbi:acyl-CoA dehydrogenase family protein [Nocardia miyunensis]|uniref:acyl-CoA dehydrogenase family protein n=1 Tax=Nocardia miyunensis TaxID=282684 RepID=UPI0008304C7F|nr:acyl-CoA dehydrogenase family protein [Nocardia miyunensis]
MSGGVAFEAEHDEFRASFRTFVEREAAGGDFFEQAGDYGFLGVQAPEEFGGGAVDDCRFAVVAAEELMRAGLTGAGLSFVTHVGVAIPWLLEHADADRQARSLPGLVSGKQLAAVAHSEVSAQQAPVGARLDGVLSAVVNAASASLLLVPVRGEDGASAVAIVDLDAAGASREIRPDVVGTRGAGLADIRLDGVVVADGDIHAGDALDRLWRAEQLWTAVVALAGARTVLDWTIDYVQQRKVFGRPVASFENTRYVLGGVLAEIISVEALVSACVLDQLGHRLDARSAAAARLRAAELFALAADQGLQLHGGYGYMREYPISEAYADSRHLRLQGGGNAAMREILAVELGL